MSSDATPVSPEPEKRGMSPVLLIAIILAASALFFLVCAGILAALLLPAVQAAREAGRRAMCVNNAMQIGIALQNYHDTYHTFPPAYLADEDGQPMHSWRVLILPFLEGREVQSLYEQYDFDEPWDGPHNRKLAAEPPSIFVCPSADDVDGQTNFLAVVGDETAWPGTNAVTLGDITKADGMSQTILLVETANSGINWLEPRDLTVDEAMRGINPERTKGNISSQHPGGATVLLSDGSVHFLDETVRPDDIHALLTIDGGEEIDEHVFGY